MRDPDRIHKIINTIDFNKYILHLKPSQVKHCTIEQWITKKDDIINYWVKNPDLRFGQLLIILKIINDGPSWFEEDEAICSYQSK